MFRRFRFSTRSAEVKHVCGTAVIFPVPGDVLAIQSPWPRMLGEKNADACTQNLSLARRQKLTEPA